MMMRSARLVEMLEALVNDAKKSGLALVPLVGIGCPGIIDSTGPSSADPPEPAWQMGEQQVQSSPLYSGGNPVHRRP